MSEASKPCKYMLCKSDELIIYLLNNLTGVAPNL